MASLFGSDPELASASSSELAEIRDQIDPVSQWLGDPDAIGVPEVGESLGEFANAASSLTADLTTRVGGASDLLGALASGTREVDQSLADRLGLTPAPGQASQGATAPAAAGARDLVGASTSSGAPRDPDNVFTGGDPVDVATGDVVLRETDVMLPGILPLVLVRSYRSSWRTGRWFGQSWMSSFDQRLMVTADRIIGAFADGRVLTWAYPNGSEGSPMLPVTGDAWPLVRNPDGSYTVADPQRGLRWRFEHRAGYETAGDGRGELPLVSVSDRIGHEIVFSYGPDGQPASVTHSGGYHVRVTVTDRHVTGLALGGRDGSADVPLMSYEFDAAGNLAGVIDSSGPPLRFSYDDATLLTSWTDRNGHSYRYVYDAQRRCIRGEGPGGALSAAFSYEPGVTRWTDATGAVTTYHMTDAALVAATTDPLGNTTRWEHDERGRVTVLIDPLGRVTRYTFDDGGNLVAITRPDGSQVTTQYDKQCQPVLVTQPDGNVWRLEYDSRGNRTGRVAPDGTVTGFDYDERGHLARLTAPDGAVVTVACDAAGQTVEVIRPDGARTRYDRDRFGRTVRVTNPDSRVTSLDWTTEGRLSARTLPDGARETWSWDAEGNRVRYESPVGAVTSYEFGPFGKITNMRLPDGTRTDFRYDRQLRLTEIIHGRLSWRYEYDVAGRLIAETDYNGARTTYAYDAAGQLTLRVNATGQDTVFRYDVLGNLVERLTDGVVTAFGYDPTGRVVYARNADAELRLQRDALGRVTAETCNDRTVTTQYDLIGQVIGRTTSSGATTSWEYDLAGLPVTMNAGGQQLRFGYNSSGQQIRRALPGELILTQDWDLSGRLAVQALTGPQQPGLSGTVTPEGPAVGEQLLQRRAYRYRADGFPDSIDDLLEGTRTLSLDPTGRVTAVTGPDWSERYTYDQVGNLASATWPSPPPGGGTGWPDAGSVGEREFTGTLVSRAGDIRYRHDRAGRVVTRQRVRISRKPDTWSYQWDADDRLTVVRTPDGTTWRYRYDPFGRRIAKQHLAADGQVLGETRFCWDGALLAEQAESADGREQVTTWDYQAGSFAPLTQAERTSLPDAPQQEIDQRFYAIITDLVGSPTELVSPDGALAGHRRQNLWGTGFWDGASTPLRFPGQYHDTETGLHYNVQRYYDPATARYASPDPLGLAPGLNPHAYVPNPLTWLDPLGLAADDGYNSAPEGLPRINNDRPVVFRKPAAGATPAQVAQIRDYVAGCNEALGANALSPTGRVSTAGQMRLDANDAVAAERAANPGAYGPGQQPGHVPDTTWTGNPVPYKWLPLDASINQSLGSQSLRYRIGYQPTGFWYIDDYIAQFGKAP
jgi:RHS repeat-associated protein